MSIVYINDIKQKCPKFLNTIPMNHNMSMKSMSMSTRTPIPTRTSTPIHIPTHITI